MIYDDFYWTVVSEYLRPNIGVNNDNGSVTDGGNKLLPETPDVQFVIDDDDEKTEENRGFDFWWSRSVGAAQLSASDLEDFAPIVLDLPQELVDSGWEPKIRVENLSDPAFLLSPAFVAVSPAVSPAQDRLGFLKSQSAAEFQLQVANRTSSRLIPLNSDTSVVDAEGNDLSAGRNEFLFRLVGGGSARLKISLVLAQGDNSAAHVADAVVINAGPVQGMYTVMSSADEEATLPFFYPSEGGRTETINAYGYRVVHDERREGVKKTAVFIHGYNVSPSDAQETFSSVYQRLYWQGFRGNFVGWNWNGDEWEGAPLPATPFDPNVDNALHTSPSLWMAIRNLMQAPESEGGWGLEADDIDLMAHSLGNLVMWDALRINAAKTDEKLVRNIVSIEAAIWREAFDPVSVLDYKLNVDGWADAAQPVVKQFVSQQMQSSWRSWLNPNTRPIKSGLTGKAIHSYLADDYALDYGMRANDVLMRHPHPKWDDYQDPAVFRTASNLSRLPTYIREDAILSSEPEVGQQERKYFWTWKDVNHAVGTRHNSVADVNINAADYGWRAKEHSDFRDRVYPGIFPWWKQTFVTERGVAIGQQ